MQTQTFHNGDAVQAMDGAEVYHGVVVEVYDDVVEVAYFDTDTLTQETMEFYVDDVQHI